MPDVVLDALEVAAFTVPTEGGPESDGTLGWAATTDVIVALHAGGHGGLGSTCTDKAAGPLIADTLRRALEWSEA